MSVIGLEEIFLDVADLERSVDFYERLLGIPVATRNDERAYLQCERSHVVLQVKGHSGRHRGGGPMHFAFTVSEEHFDEVASRVDDGRIFTRGPMGQPWQGPGPVHPRPGRQRGRGEHALSLRRAEALKADRAVPCR